MTARVAVVTGAGRGIGRAVALRLAADGAAVVLAGRGQPALDSVAAEIGGFGGQALVAPCDVTSEASVASLAQRALKAYGRVDLLCANSGIAGPTAPLAEVSPQDWQDTFAVNVYGVFLCCRAVLPGMLARGSGSIVVIGSVTGKRPMPNRTPYAASKLALVGLVRSLAAEVGERGVRVNLVSPGPVEGERLDTVIERAAAAAGAEPEQVRQRLLADMPLRRFVTAAEVAAAVAFLAGEDASGTTGQDLNVAAGMVMS